MPYATYPAPQGIDIEGIPIDHNAALVLDLPGADAIWMGLALAKHGYRPVPLYNSLPGPRTPILTPLGTNLTSIVDVHPIIAALQLAAIELSGLSLSPDAPPAFLLDANRRGAGQVVAPGRFDNRSISFTTDFPSATFLLAHDFQRAVLVQGSHDQPQPDLAHTLRRWQDASIAIVSKRLAALGVPVPIVIEKPSAFDQLWQRALGVIGLRRHGLGGFGGVVPMPSAG